MRHLDDHMLTGSPLQPQIILLQLQYLLIALKVLDNNACKAIDGIFAQAEPSPSRGE